ncbi:MAG: LamG-like jellyroll fold domain-containing protein [Cyanobacteriota bacterium]|nr:LamG-like jellyroll fold domain-containing protein [Cyanobacteriota bacterium]
MKKLLTLTALMLATPIITQPALAAKLGPLPKDVTYSSDGTFDSPNIFFNNPTDTIQIFGQTQLGNESTYEARIYFPKNVGAGGLVFNEHKYGLEDKVLRAGPNTLFGYNFPINPGIPFTATRTPLPDTWHHIAFVQGGGTQRLYFDGQIVGSQTFAGNIQNSNGGATLGARIRGNENLFLAPSFIGHLDTLRISNVARYTGSSFDAPTGDLSSDTNTLMLYNFNLEDYFQQDGFTWVSDLSNNGRNGRFSTGFASATSPSVVVPVEQKKVPEPSSILGLFALGGLGVSSLLKRKSQ